MDGTDVTTTQTRMPAMKWGLLTLLIASIFLNYIDRGTLSVAAPRIADEFVLGPERMGSLFSAFFWTYALLQLFGIAGWAADRSPVGYALAGGAFLWSVATVATGFVSSFSAMFAARLVLGAGESVAYPCYSRILASDFPAERRGLANSLIDAGSKLGPALGSFIGGMVLASIGWRGFFVALGVISLVWLVPWFVWMPRTGASAVAQLVSRPSISDILKQRAAWGAFFAHFCGNYYWFFLLTWLPSYLVTERRFSMQGMAKVSSVAFILIALATLTAGWISDHLIARGYSATRVRKAVVVSGLSFATIILPAGFTGDLTTCIVFLYLGCIGFGTFTSNHWAITQTLAGPLAAGRWSSLQNGVGNLAGVAASWLTGAIVEKTHSFPPAFVIAATFALVGAFCWGVVVGPVEPVEWKNRERLA
ncbi:MAG: MFS transporter [Bryobacterales bacterium]|nr:MFS transporter [Bryobacterales bacterium]